MPGFFERLEARAGVVDSLLCVGLDPHPDDLPESSAAAAREFCLRLIEATHPFAAAFKPNSAFFEIYGAAGIEALAAVIAAVPQGIPVVLDAKRGDIGSTSAAYARAAFDTLGANAITVNPYLGQDAVQPFLDDPGKGVFLLCRTSNPGAGDLQDLMTGGAPLYMEVARLAERWNTKSNLGLVVGATYPAELAELRGAHPELWFLAPGIGAQGADLKAALSAGLRSDGMGLLVPVSRGISRAADPATAARGFRDELNDARRQPQALQAGLDPARARLADDLLRLGCVQFGEFTLKSGAASPIYLDLRRLAGDPVVLARAARAYLALLHPLVFDRVAGLPYAALPIAAAICLQGGWPLVYPRKEVKDYGTKSAVEGPYIDGETVVVVDDLITTGGSKFEAIDKLKAAGLNVTDVAVLVDRGSGAAALAERGLHLHSVFMLHTLLDYWRARDAITQEQYAAALAFLEQV
ncbi:MAG: orotidine-5'-phosphate decarboxylase [Anaerolineae bacterium]|nr:MAG: orotidine-5'-phosphate decarboxylase [Anaerolineae bacterium]